MRVGVVKPDWGIVGGYELVLERVESDLRAAGHEVTRVSVSVPDLPRHILGVTIEDGVWERLPEFFRHMATVAAFQAIDVSSFDLILATQPGSYAVRHPRILGLFYHHARVFFDLLDVYIAAGYVPEHLHRHAAARTQRVDVPHLDAVSHLLVPSRTVEARLQRYNHLEGRCSPFLAGRAAGAPVATGAGRPARSGRPLCVSRHEFPKRTELFCLALALLPGTEGTLVGSGSRVDAVKDLAAALATGTLDAGSVDSRDLWLTTGGARHATPGSTHPALAIPGRVSDGELERLYSECLCVVAPAYDEDYGLTALEAMAHAKPVIVCADGGGLAELVDDGETGLVVEPTAVAIAEAIRLLIADRGLAQRLGSRGREVAEGFTWDRARHQLFDGVERAMSGG